VLDVVLGGPDADHELLGDLAVREAVGDERQDLRLAFRQPEALPFLRDDLGQVPLAARGREVRERCAHVTAGRVQQVVGRVGLDCACGVHVSSPMRVGLEAARAAGAEGLRAAF
jgi:hypothetical protein